MKFLKRLKKKHKALTTSNITFSYSKKEILRDISISIKPGELVAIIGKSGCGKSTFLKIISGIIPSPSTGKIKIFGKNKIFNKNKIGFVSQEISIIPDLSILDNIKISGLALGISETKAQETALELLKMLKLEKDLNLLPTSLSGGEKVRLNIILSLLHNPKILILDEPFVGLDFLNRRLLWHFLESLRKKGNSIILTSHLLTETQEHVDRLIILKNKKIFFQGSLEQLKTKLKINYLLEIRLSYLSKENLEKIKKHCAYKDIKILDSYERYLMFGINSSKQKDNLTTLLTKLNLKFQEISFREPNLDETFLKA